MWEGGTKDELTTTGRWECMCGLCECKCVNVCVCGGSKYDNYTHATQNEG